MKRLLCLSVVGGLLAFSASTALAAQGGAAEGMYLSAKVGLAVLADSDLNFSDGSTSKLSFDNGFGLDVALGYQLPMFRVEGEVAYRANDMDESSDSGGTDKINGDLKALSGMVNGYYDFCNATAFTPYVGVGIGVAKLDFSVEEGLDESDTVFAYQMMVGAGYALTKQISLEVEYRYFGTQDPEFDDGLGGTVEAEVSDHNLMVGLRILF